MVSLTVFWVTARPGAEQTALNKPATQITDNTGIRLEHEAAYDWVAFVPQRNSDAGALTKYFGSVADRNGYKDRGIECRQRSTPPFIADVQETLIEVFDAYRSPEAVCDRLQQGLNRLQAGNVNPEELGIEQRTSKSAAEYAYLTRTVAALERAGNQGRESSPGQKINYVVVDDLKQSIDRVQLVCETSQYDADFYAAELLQATESVLSPVGWRQDDITHYIADRIDASLAAYSNLISHVFFIVFLIGLRENDGCH